LWSETEQKDLAESGTGVFVVDRFASNKNFYSLDVLDELTVNKKN